ncbi:hypothetical protein [Agromyces bauzanensis]|uniref:Septum formation initiator family protein n=1 Tax=Agromyces bauzanensis TaxID=1308924 RepID=A0A917PAZ4_9MICO|nr:hypothetical protein [Agromyces bauzanensis]GGJ69150.1 hypothetical protein GCM10011372_03710 [Agromyces bauzanensis]
MTALPAQSVPAPRRRPAPAPQRRLRPAPEPRTGLSRPRLAYAIIAVGAVAIIVVAQLLLSIAVAQGAYDIDRLQLQRAELAREEQKLAEELDRLESPQYLAMNAEALGMVPNTDPVYLRLSDGAVLGEPTAASAGAAASAPLVPNALIDGVPPVTAPQAGQTPSGGAGGEAPAGGAGTQVVAPPPVSEGLPTPATH